VSRRATTGFAVATYRRRVLTDQGRVQFEGRDITARRPARIAALAVARTFQNVAVFPSLSVLDNLMLGRHLHMRAGVLARSWTGGRLVRREGGIDGHGGHGRSSCR
jgi:ABC-type branched-subunit amino acid transport system ATPase component